MQSMWKRVFLFSPSSSSSRATFFLKNKEGTAAAAACRYRHSRPSSSTNKTTSTSSGMSTAVDSVILRSLKDHYLEASKMSPPPKIKPPAPFEIVKGSIDKDGGTVVLRRTYNGEVVDVSVMRLANFSTEEEEEDALNQLFLYVDVTKTSSSPGENDGVHFLCALYPDAIGIHSVSFGPKLVQPSHDSNLYQARAFQELEPKLRDAFHMYIEERGINENLFPFLQAWLYVKDHRNLMKWFKSVGLFINQKKT